MRTHRIISILFLISSINVTIAGLQKDFKCAICGMEIKKDAKIVFESVKDSKPIHFCSFSCVHGFHGKFKDAHISAYDFSSGQRIDDVKAAYFLIKSKNILREVEFGMPPIVVAFSDEATARKMQSNLKDGEVIKGYETLEKVFH